MSKYREVIYPCAFLFCLGIAGSQANAEKESEVKDRSEPVHRLSVHHNNNAGDNVPPRYLHKRQIDPQFQSFGRQQFFSRPSFNDADFIDFNTGRPSNDDDNSAPFNRRPVFSSQDEEERFFLSRETTTLNPLSFFTAPTTTTTQDPVEQQRVEEQRRFQEEIANRGLREQMERSFGLRTTSTTTTTTTTPSPDPFSFEQLRSEADPFLSNVDSAFRDTETVSDSLLELTRSQLQNRFRQNDVAPARSYSFVRNFRRRRAIEDEQAPENELDDLTVSSTASPQQALVNTLLQDTNPREDLAKIGGWLFENLAKTVERNIAHFAGGTTRPRSVAQSTPGNFFSSPFRSTPRPFRVVNPTEPPSNYLSQEYHSTPRPVQNFLASQQAINAFQEYQSTPNPVRNFAPVEEYQSTPKRMKNLVPVELAQNYFQEYQSTARPIKQLFISPEMPLNPAPVPVTYAQTTPKIDFGQFQWNIAQPNEVVWRQDNVVTTSPNFETVTYPSTTTTRVPNIAVPLMVAPQNAVTSTTLLPRIRNVQVLPAPTSIPEESLVYRTNGNLYNLKQQTTLRPAESTTVYLQPSSTVSTEDEASITSLFKAKLGAEIQQQSNQFFDLLGQSNATVPPNGVDSGSSSPGYPTPSSAIFVKMPDDEPTSTAGYIFDRTISAKHKKESNYGSKKNNRSPQMLKSTLVYRTPPGKRATLTRSELAKNEQLEAGLLSHILEAQGKPISSWLLGQQVRQTTTGRPFVSALMNLIRKRSLVQ